MAHRIELVEDDRYVRVSLTGVVTRAEHEEFRAGAVSALTKTGWHCVLFDVTGADPKMSWTDDFEYTSGHPSQLPPQLRTAIVHGEDATERFRFVETVAVNRGVNIRAFDDEARALEWLLGV